MKYTVIYNDRWQSGSHWHSITKVRRVELKECETVRDMLIRECIENAEYIFDGWPKMEGE